jgi:hypothetical protein
MTDLLNVDANPKTVKGRARGYMTAVLYLSPFTLAGKNLCPTAAAAGCWRTCLNVSGHGGIPTGEWIHSAESPAFSVPDNNVQRARLARTKLWHTRRSAFMEQLVHEIASMVRKAKRAGLTPCVRLNGTSDIAWERVSAYSAISDPDSESNIFARFPDVQFYDYTKLPARLGHPDHATRELHAGHIMVGRRSRIPGQGRTLGAQHWRLASGRGSRRIRQGHRYHVRIHS